MIDDIEQHVPYNEQEACDKTVMLNFMRMNEDVFLRANPIAHMTASSWIVNRDRSRVLLAYHNIYNSWTWSGGHADGDRDLLRVALREAREETGIEHVHAVTPDIYSLEILNVKGHIKHGKYVSSHLHLNVTYLLEADESDELHIRAEENSGVRWFMPDDAVRVSTEPWFAEHILKKLNQRLKQF